MSMSTLVGSPRSPDTRQLPLDRRRPLRSADDRGHTLVELLVAMTIFGSVIAITMGAVIVLVGLSREVTTRADAQSEVRLGLADISKQMRSGNVLFSPKDEPGSCLPAPDGSDRGSCMRIYTQTNGTPRCVQWQVLEGTPAGGGRSVLRTRSWSPGAPAGVTAWRTVARGLTLDLTNPPFELQGASTPYDRRLLNVSLLAYDQVKNRNVSIKSAISGRNTSYGYDTGQCVPVPAE